MDATTLPATLEQQPEQYDLAEQMQEYFGNKPTKEIADALLKKIDAYYDYLRASGKLKIYRRSYEYYYHGLIRGGKLGKAGEQDEFTTIKVNHYRNILVHLLVNTTSQRPSFEPRSTNTDYKSQAQVIVARGVLDFYDREKRMGRYFKDTTETGLVFSEGWLVLDWDASLGKTVAEDAQSGEEVKEGDITFDAFNPVDVIIDHTLRGPQHDWVIYRKFKNKYDMAAKYPDLAEKILGLSNSGAKDRDLVLLTEDKLSDTDNIPVFVFRHAKTPAVPEGRYVEFLSSDIVTIDGGLPFSKIHAYRMAPDELEGTPFGYTIGFDLLPIQEAIDGLHSTVVTNQSTFGVQNIWSPKGANLSVQQMGGGLNFLESDPKYGKPEPLNLTNTPPEIFEYIQQLEHLMETLSGVNSVTRGNPEASLKSGAALALVASQAIQFNSGLQQSYAQLLEDVGTAVVDILKTYANTPRLIAISGKANRSMMQQFKGTDIADITRVTVDMGNPMSRTTAGKLQIADTLLQNGMIKNPDEYIQVATTGQLEPLIEGQQAQIMLIRAENEDMAEGKAVQAIMTDDHRLHILEHQVVLASPEARENPQAVQAALTHVMQHIQLLQTGDPILMGLLGQPVLAQPGGPGGPPPPGGGPPPPGGPASPPMPEQVDATNPVVADAQSVNMPQVPEAPPTGGQ